MMNARSRCARRRRRLAPLALDIVFARGAGRPLAPAALAAALACVHLFSSPGEVGLYLAPSFALFLSLLLIALFDAAYFIIPDGPIGLLGAVGLATTLAADPAETPSRLVAAGAGYAALRLVALGYAKWSKVEGVGEGDARLFAIAGLFVGFRGLPGCLVFAVLSALIAALIALRAERLKDANEPIPFGPHLALGLWLVWSIGPLEI